MINQSEFVVHFTIERNALKKASETRINKSMSPVLEVDAPINAHSPP